MSRHPCDQSQERKIYDCTNDVATENRGRDTERRQLRSRQIIEVATRDEWLDQLTRSLIRKIDVVTKI